MSGSTELEVWGGSEHSEVTTEQIGAWQAAGRESLSRGRRTNSGVTRRHWEEMLLVVTSLSSPSPTADSQHDCGAGSSRGLC